MTLHVAQATAPRPMLPARGAELSCWRRRGPGRPRKPIETPPRCRACDGVIPRRLEGYALEAPSNYLRRKFCDLVCARGWIDRPEARPAANHGTRSGSFDSYVLGRIGRLTPKQPAELHSEIVNDWGAVSYRTLARSIARLRRAGRIVHTGDGYVRMQSRERRAA